MAKKKPKTEKSLPNGKSASVRIEKIVNGYTVSAYNKKSFQDRTYFAKTKKEAKESDGKMLKI